MDRLTRKRRRGEAANASEDGKDIDGSDPAAIANNHVSLTKDVKDTIGASLNASLVKPKQNAKFDEEMQELDKMAQSIQDGTYPEMRKELEALELKRQKLIQAADVWRNFQLGNMTNLYEYEVYAAAHVCEAAKKVIKEDHLRRTREVITKLKEQLEGTPEALAKITKQIQAHSKAKDGSLDVTLEKRLKTLYNEVVKARHKVLRPQLFQKALTADEITNDLMAIHQNWISIANKVCNGTDHQMQAIIMGQQLRLGSQIFKARDEVVVRSEISDEEFVGNIVSILPDEVYVKVATGNRIKIRLAYLQNGRCRISHYAETSSSSESDSDESSHPEE